MYSNANNTLHSLVSPLYSHIPRALLHIPSTPLNRPCTPIHPRTFYISPLLSCIVFVSHISPYPSSHTLCSLVSSLYSHVSPYPSTYPLYSLVSSLSLIYPRTLLHILPCVVFVLPYIPVPSTYPLHSLVSSFHSHIYPYPSTYTLYSLVSSFFSHISLCPSTYPLYYLPSSLYSYISPYPSTHTLYSLMSSLYSHISPYLLHIPSTPICRLCSPIYPRTFLPTPSTPLYRPYTLIYIPLMNLQVNGLASSLVKSRSKRSYHHSHSKKLSIKDLALELAKKHLSSIILKT